MTTAVFGLIGVETVAITAAENKDLRKEETVKIATRKICLRLILLYTLATFTVGLNVQYNYPTMANPAVNIFGYGESSSFVISAVLNRVSTLPLVINDFIIFSALTAGVNGCYNASRTLHAIASDRDAWPDWAPIQALRSRLERTSYGNPYVAVFVSWLFGWLAFIGATPYSSEVVC
jgi:yeast amino acid transporter